MSKTLNSVQLIGHTGKDPEVKNTTSGTTIANFSIATSEKFKDKSGTMQERTDWHNVVAYGKAAEIIAKYVVKGTKLHIQGRLQNSSWEDKTSGQKRYKTEIVVSDFILLSSPNGSSNGNGSGNSHEQNAPADYAIAEFDGGIEPSNVPF